MVTEADGEGEEEEGSSAVPSGEAADPSGPAAARTVDDPAGSEAPTAPAEPPEVDAAGTGGDAQLPPVQVFVRLRPLLGWERGAGLESTSLQLKDGPGGAVTLRHREGSDDPKRPRSFRFDGVVGPEKSQQELWDLARVSPLVERVAAGYHATVFAYGQTGTGKTHTMEGFAYDHQGGGSSASRPRARPKDTPEEQLGLVPRAVQTLFQHLEREAASGSSSTCVRVSFLQIYNEHIYDLLNPPRREAGREEPAGLRLRWDPGKSGFYVENLFEYECQTADEVLQHYTAGVQCRHVASTNMNTASSRSHTVLRLTVVRRSSLAAAGAGEPVLREVSSRLSLVDLAGSERASASSGCEKSATRFHEAVNVNQSLFVLRRVITALSKRAEPSGDSKGHIPYRESKLTSLLQHAIGGAGYLMMLACLSPADKHYEENLSTLQYASQAANIKNEPTINMDPKDKLIQTLQAQLAAAHAYILRVTGLDELPAELLDVSGASVWHRGAQPRAKRARSIAACSEARARSHDREARPPTCRRLRCCGDPARRGSRGHHPRSGRCGRHGGRGRCRRHKRGVQHGRCRTC